MRYLCVRWVHDFPEEPVWLYSEVDDDRWETRKVWIFPNGSMERADGSNHTERVWLAVIQIPDSKVISMQPEFEAKDISADEFEQVWEKARNLT